MPAASGCTTSKLRSSLWIFRVISRRCLRFSCCQLPCVGRQVAFLGFSFCLGFMLTYSTSNSTWLGPVGETYSISPAGSGLYPFQDKPPPSTQSPIPEPSSFVGQERSRENYGLSCRTMSCLGF